MSALAKQRAALSRQIAQVAPLVHTATRNRTADVALEHSPAEAGVDIVLHYPQESPKNVF